MDTAKPSVLIQIEDAHPENFAPFGALVEPPVDGGRVSIPTALSLDTGDGGGTLTFITLNPAPLESMRSAQLERHPYSVQVFIPLGDAPMICVVSQTGSTPEGRGDLRAFRTRPGQAIVLQEGTWHLGMMCEGKTMVAATFIYRLASGADTETLPLKTQLRLVSSVAD